MRLLIGLLVALLPGLSWGEPCDALAKKVCPTGADLAQCGAFIDAQMVDGKGQALAGPPRLTACQLALDDAPTLAQLTDEMKLRAEGWVLFDVQIAPTRDNGKAWDALGGAPDVAACFVVDGNPMECAPGGTSLASVQSPQCKDALQCTFKVKAAKGVSVSVDFVDVDASDNDPIAGCVFTVGQPETLKCPNEAKITLRP